MSQCTSRWESCVLGKWSFSVSLSTYHLFQIIARCIVLWPRIWDSRWYDPSYSSYPNGCQSCFLGNCSCFVSFKAFFILNQREMYCSVTKNLRLTMIWPFIFTVPQWLSILHPRELLLLRKSHAFPVTPTQSEIYCSVTKNLRFTMLWHFIFTLHQWL